MQGAIIGLVFSQRSLN